MGDKKNEARDRADEASRQLDRVVEIRRTIEALLTQPGDWIAGEAHWQDGSHVFRCEAATYERGVELNKAIVAALAMLGGCLHGASPVKIAKYRYRISFFIDADAETASAHPPNVASSIEEN
jgi:hypothetical protein